MQILKVENLNYNYGFVSALNNINFTIESGSITALVGPNGAGKSTLMRCLAGLDIPFSGNIVVYDNDIIKNPKLSHTKIGYLSDNFGLYEDLSVYDVLRYFCGCHNIENEDSKISEVSEILNLNGVLQKKCNELSRGWRQRVGIAITLIHNPKLLILDEPASGLDPESRTDLSGIFKLLQQKQIDIIVSSHILAELEDYCSSMLVMRNGCVVDHVSLEQHREVNNKVFIISFFRNLSSEEVNTLKGIIDFDFTYKDTDLLATTDISPQKQNQIIKLLVKADLPISQFFTKEKSLQELYLEMAKK